MKKIIYFLILVVLGVFLFSGQKTFQEKVRKSPLREEVSIPLDLRTVSNLKVSEGHEKQGVTSEPSLPDLKAPLMKSVEEFSVAKITLVSDEALKVPSPSIVLLKEPQGGQYPLLQENRVVNNFLEKTRNSTAEFGVVVEPSSLEGENSKQIPNDQVENVRRVFVGSPVNAQLPLVSVQVPDSDPLLAEKIVSIPEQKLENTGNEDVVGNEDFGEELVEQRPEREGNLAFVEEEVEQVSEDLQVEEVSVIEEPVEVLTVAEVIAEDFQSEDIPAEELFVSEPSVEDVVSVVAEVEEVFEEFQVDEVAVVEEEFVEIEIVEEPVEVLAAAEVVVEEPVEVLAAAEVVAEEVIAEGSVNEKLTEKSETDLSVVEENLSFGSASVALEQPKIIESVLDAEVEKEIVEDFGIDEVVGIEIASSSLEQPRIIGEGEKVGLLSIFPRDPALEQSLVDDGAEGSGSFQNNMSIGLAGATLGMSVEKPEAPIVLGFDPSLGHQKGKIIVKFKSQGKYALNECAHCLLENRTSFQLALEDSSNSIDQLNKDCGVTRAKSVFVQRHNMTTQEAMSEEDLKYSLIKNKFPQRTARITKNAEIPDLTNFYVMDVPLDADIDSICELYNNDPHVEFAQPVRTMKIEVFPADPPNDTFYASDQWHLNNTGQTGGTVDADIDAPEAWVENLGNNIIVAINDTGVDYTHEDLLTNIWSNTDETVNGVDSDGNGYIDDIRGWDFYDNDNDPLYDPSPLSSTFHGTHVAGTVAAVGNNGKGVIGVAPNAKIMVVKGFGVSGGSVVGSSSTLAPGIIYAAQNGADVINNSWGCSSACPSDPTVEAAVTTAYGLGSVVVFAAGNDDVDVVNYSPQNMTEPVVVAASDDDDLNSSFSNFGSTVDVIAPGSNIASTYPGDLYAASSGTSMAAPHTAGLAALILSKNSALNLTNAQVEAVLQDTSDSYNKLAGDTANDYGDGRINAYNAVILKDLIPTMSAGIDRSVDYGNLLQFTVSASDPFNDSLTLTAVLSAGGTLGSIGASFTDNGDKTGQFSWTPTVSQIGLNPTISFTSTDPDSFSDSDTMLITVNSGAVCGDGTVDVGEQCDDSNTTACDGCSSNCQTEACGNGTTECTEGCDDGNTTSGDGCTAMCVDEVCGDGTVNNGAAEQCDDSNTTACDGCSATCQTEVCGNGNQECFEGCDDGNTTSGDGCTSTCVAEVCGDGAVNNGGSEECDDGNTTSGDGCTAACIDEFCGDGVVNDGGSEECDDGNASSLDGCSTSCVIVSVCGDLVCEMGENCSSCWQDCGRCRGGSRPRR